MRRGASCSRQITKLSNFLRRPGGAVQELDCNWAELWKWCLVCLNTSGYGDENEHKMDGLFIMSKRGAKDRGPQPLPKAQQMIQDEIGTKLRQFYAGMIEEPVPDRFVDLLKQLEKDKDRTG